MLLQVFAFDVLFAILNSLVGSHCVLAAHKSNLNAVLLQVLFQTGKSHRLFVLAFRIRTIVDLSKPLTLCVNVLYRRLIVKDLCLLTRTTLMSDVNLLDNLTKQFVHRLKIVNLATGRTL